MSGIDWHISFYHMIENWGRNLGAIAGYEDFEALRYFKEHHQQKRSDTIFDQYQILNMLNDRLSPRNYNSKGRAGSPPLRSTAKRLDGLWLSSQTVSRQETLSREVTVISIREIAGYRLLELKMVTTYDGRSHSIPISGVIFQETLGTHIAYLWDMEELDFSIAQIEIQSNRLRLAHINYLIDEHLERSTFKFEKLNVLSYDKSKGGLRLSPYPEERNGTDYEEIARRYAVDCLERFKWRIA